MSDLIHVVVNYIVPPIAELLRDVAREVLVALVVLAIQQLRKRKPMNTPEGKPVPEIPDDRTLQTIRTSAERLTSGQTESYDPNKALDPFADVALELSKARIKHAPMRSAHEAYAVILEELDEVWAEIKANSIDREKLRKELTHVAAMAIRAIDDLKL